MARLQKIRSSKEAVFKAEDSRYSKAFASSMHGPVTDTLDDAGSKAQLKAMQLDMLQLKTQITALQKRDDEIKNWEAEMDAKVEAKVNIMIEKRMKVFLGKNDTFDQLLEGHSISVSERSSELKKEVDQKVNSLSSSLSALQGFRRDVEEQKLEAQKQSSQFSLGLDENLKNLNLLQQKLEALTRESAAKNPQVERKIQDLVDPLTKRLDSFENGFEERLKIAIAESEKELRIHLNKCSNEVGDDIETRLVQKIGLESDTTTQQVDMLSSKISAVEAGMAAAQNGLAMVGNNIAALEKKAHDYTVREDFLREISARQTEIFTLKNRLKDDMNSEISKVKALIPASPHALTLPASNELLSKVSAVQEFVETLGSDLSKVEESLHTCKEDVKVLQKDIPELIVAPLTKLEARINEQLQQIKEAFALHSREMDAIKVMQAQAQPRQDSTSRNGSQTNTPQPSVEISSQIKHLSMEINRIREDISAKVSDSDAIKELQDQMASVVRGVQIVEQRYENISTADLYSQMINQLQTMYPNAPGFLDQLRVLQEQCRDFRSLAKYLNDVCADLKGNMDGNQSRVKELEGQINLLANNLSQLDGRTQKLENHVDISLKADKKAMALEAQLEKVARQGESLSIDINQRLADIDDIIRMKDGIIKSVRAWPVIFKNADRLSKIVENINFNSNRPLQGLNMESARINPFSNDQNTEG